MAKTPYQRRRAFINKINKRIKNLVEKAGVDKQDIEDLIDIDGVWFTETGNLNITAENFSLYESEIEKLIEKAVPTYKSLRKEFKANLEFVNKARGIEEPISSETLNDEIKGYFRTENRWKQQNEAVYELDEIEGNFGWLNGDTPLGSFPYEDQVRLDEIRSRRRKIGRDYRHGDITKAEAARLLQEVDDMMLPKWKTAGKPQEKKPIRKWGEKQ